MYLNQIMVGLLGVRDDSQKTNNTGQHNVCCCSLQLMTSESIRAMITFILKPERLLVSLTAPLKELRIPLSALKCITINVMWDSYRMACLLGDKHGTRTKEEIKMECGYKRSDESIRLLGINFWENIITVERRMPSDSRLSLSYDGRLLNTNTDRL